MTGAQPSPGTTTSLLPDSEEMNPLRRSQLPSNSSYGSIGSASRTSGSASPKLDRVPEERSPTFISIEDAEEEVELDLEDQGYFVGKQIPPRFPVSSFNLSLSRLVSALDSLLHVRPARFPPYLDPRRLLPSRFHPNSTAPSPPKIFPTPSPRIYHICSNLVVFTSAPPSPLLPHILGGKQLECGRDPPCIVARDCVQYTPPRYPSYPRHPK